MVYIQFLTSGPGPVCDLGVGDIMVMMGISPATTFQHFSHMKSAAKYFVDISNYLDNSTYFVMFNYGTSVRDNSIIFNSGQYSEDIIKLAIDNVPYTPARESPNTDIALGLIPEIIFTGRELVPKYVILIADDFTVLTRSVENANYLMRNNILMLIVGVGQFNSSLLQPLIDTDNVEFLRVPTYSDLVGALQSKLPIQDCGKMF